MTKTEDQIKILQRKRDLCVAYMSNYDPVTGLGVNRPEEFQKRIAELDSEITNLRSQI
jgi:hypothetical protein